MVIPIFEKTKMGIYFNLNPLIGPEEKVLGNYSKTYIPFSLGVPEKYNFRPISEFPVFKTRRGNIGIITCYDRLFPEAFRIAAIKEVMTTPLTLYLNVEGTVAEDWEYLAWTRVKESGVYAIFVNRSGEEEGLKYFVNSLIVDLSEKVLARGNFKESIATATVDVKDVAEGKQTLLEGTETGDLLKSC